MRSTSAIAGILIMVLATAGFGCATGWNDASENSSCASKINSTCIHAKLAPIRAVPKSGCGHTLKSLPDQCNLRTFAQFQIFEFRSFDLINPLRVTGRSSAPVKTRLLVLSIGSPETDRGPPSRS